MNRVHVVRPRAPRRMFPADRAQRLAIALCSSMLIGLAVSFALLLRGAVRIEQADFLVFYAAGKLVATGHAAGIYSMDAIKQVELLQFPHARITEGSFLYPPYAALALAPLGLLGYTAAYVGWLLLNLMLLGLAVRALQHVAHLEGAPAVLLWVASLSFFPVFVTLIKGQSSIAILALLVLFFVCHQADRSWPAGVALALALFKPTLIVPIVAVHLVRRHWNQLWAFVAVTAVLVAAPLLVAGMRSYSGYLAALRNANALTDSPGFAPESNHSLWSFWRLLLPPIPSQLVAGVCIAAVMVAICMYAHGARDDALPLAAAMVAGVLVSPHLLIHDLIILILPAVILILYAPGARAYVVLVVGYVAAIASEALAPAIHVQFSVIATLLLFGLLLASARAAERAHTAPIVSA